MPDGIWEEIKQKDKFADCLEAELSASCPFSTSSWGYNGPARNLYPDPACLASEKLKPRAITLVHFALEFLAHRISYQTYSLMLGD